MKIHHSFAGRAAGVAASAVLIASLGGARPVTAEPNDDAPATTASAHVANNTLLITGTNGADSVLIGQAGDPNQLVVNVNGTSTAFDRATFDAIDVNLGDGDDGFRESPGIVSDERLTVSGGRGNDSIETGDNNDLIFGGSGDDFIDSGRGDDLVFAGLGDDFVDGGVGSDVAFLGVGKDAFQWDPGEGSDIVDGGPGQGDAMMIFNGAAVADAASLSANGHRAVFLRSPGNVRMDMDGIERLQFNTFGGADSMTVNDMRGTDIRRVDVDLSVNDGGFGVPDGAVDNITVNGSDKADDVDVTGDGGIVNVAGLAAETTISGPDATDQLGVNTLDGNDTVNVDAGATAIMGVATNLGAGQH
jgi:hypothetical protein